MKFNSKPDPYVVGLVILGVSLLILIASICAVTLSSEKLLKEIGVGACLGIFLGGVGLLAGVMMTLGNKPETTRAERLRNSMSQRQWELHQNRRSSRIGFVIAGVSLLVVIVTVLANQFFPLRAGQDGQSVLRILGISFGGAGVLSGIIVAAVYHYQGLRAAGRPVDNRHAGFAMVLWFSGVLAVVLAGASAIGERSWGIGVVVVTLSIFEVWAMFWAQGVRHF